MFEIARIPSIRLLRISILSLGVAVFVSGAGHAGSPLTLSIVQDPSVKATQLDITFERRVQCKKPSFPPNVEVVTEHGTLKVGGKKTVYISELKVGSTSEKVCFMPEHTVQISTGSGAAQNSSQTVPAETWDQMSQTLDIKRVTALIGGARVEVSSSCLGKAKLDTAKNQKVLEIKQTGNAIKKPTSSGKAGAPSKVSLSCQVTSQP